MTRADRLAKGIYWDRSWNPFTGCSPVGAGCDNCWARRMAHRLKGRYGYPADEPFRPTFHPERLSQVNSKQKPQVIALCFMSDPFHEGHGLVDTIWRMLGRINACPQHAFIALTKRPERMRKTLLGYIRHGEPIPNLIGGVSVWDQESADRMVSILLQTNLATRIVSLEPCLGLVDLGLPGICPKDWGMGYIDVGSLIDGVILGGESGPGARPMHPDIPRSVRDQCQAAGVPFYFKQWGEYIPDTQYWWGGRWMPPVPNSKIITGEAPNFALKKPGFDYLRLGKKATGRLLDGRTWDELPEVMKDSLAGASKER